jgi:ABC-type transport system involved in cytochrome bd biosynthesis fused ATPase/permease subunit
MFITNLSDFFHTAAVFLYNNAIVIMAVLTVIVLLNAVRLRAVKTRARRRQMKQAAVVVKSNTSKNTFDPFAKLDF